MTASVDQTGILQLDAHTLRDLEVFGTGDGEAPVSLFELVNHDECESF